MIKRQQRLARIVAVEQEYQAALTAAEWLKEQLSNDPSFGDKHGWNTKSGLDYYENLETTYIVRLFSEFETGLRDYWETYLGKPTEPTAYQLVCQAIPNQRFPQDTIDKADEVRKYRNFLVHDPGANPPADVAVFTVKEVKRHLAAYFALLDAQWR
jgi:hypothetical protein